MHLYHRNYLKWEKHWKQQIFLILCAGFIGLFFLENPKIPGIAAKELVVEGISAVTKHYMPVVFYQVEGDPVESWLELAVNQIFPLAEYVDEGSVHKEGDGVWSNSLQVESTLPYEVIEAREAADENYIDETTGQVVETGEVAADTLAESGGGSVEIPEQYSAGSLAAGQKVTFSIDKLQDFDYLTQTFYQVDRTTTITAEELKAAELLDKNMSLSHDASTPQILIYHTHSQEGYADSIPQDASTSVVAVGDYLAKILSEQYGYNVIHDTGTYDLADRDHAYSRAAPALEAILAANPSIEIVIDLHRDGVNENTRLVTTQNGVEMAKIMFFNGLSRTTGTGDIAYLYNPYIKDNLAFSLQMQLTAAEYYPDFTRKIYLKGYRYNMHYCPKTLLIEVGAQTNTLLEAKNAMVPLADVLNKVIGKT